MWTYRISPPKAQVEEVTLSEGYLARDAILARQVARCPLIIGDRVSIKGQPHGKNRAKVVDILTEARQCSWRHNNTQPCFVVVEVQKTGKVEGIELHYGYEVAAYPLKLLKKV